jgi:hypothetical protein
MAIPIARLYLLCFASHRYRQINDMFLHDLGYTTGEFGKNHLGEHVQALPTAHG